MKAGKSGSLRRSGIVCALLIMALVGSTGLLRSVLADSLPQVRLNAEGIGPRSIEELTGHNVARDYAYAWRDLALALDKNQASLLDGYFTGFAKDNLVKRVSDQKKTGIRVRYIDRGHQVKALFYAPDGGEMQLLDKATVEQQILDGNNVIHQENSTTQYLVLMTPGADRWFVRSLEPLPDSANP